MNNIEKAAQAALPEQGGVLRPLERANGAAPVLGTPALVTATGVFFVAGNMVLDLVGHESAAKHDGAVPTGKSGAELLSMRANGLRG
ncbi:hypothetical protein [Saccharomonospora glauca]|jgi:hypothetical protein|uniref:Uncharacterized protein n=1 Tax=Saccharomonospora glauca K62 TaxID=928724 RepID=I1D0R3_9PSEU|nr:hypothetical protein [Saccharomonospora glauca]EIE98537.1 hypothetical protein SacglDRAFT_01622 [Saccharomonospora glauca K62]